MVEYKIYCGGEFVSSKQKLAVTNKFTGKTHAWTYLGDKQILNKAIVAAEKAKPACGELSAHERSLALKFVANELEKAKEHFAELLCIESAKPMVYALTEIERAIQTFTIAAEECKRLPKEYLSLDWTPAGKGKEGIVKYFPIGIVAGISPFNYPLNLAVHKIAPAIAAGCPIILKPASATPLSTLALAKILAKSGLPKGSVSILPMDRKTGNLLVTDERISLLSFTGSPAVGWEIKKQSGKKKIVLELGGNAGVIVSKSANLEAIIKSCMVGAFSYSGQICIHAQRFFVHKDVYADFLERMVGETKKLVNKDPLKKDTLVSCLIDSENAKRVEEWVNEAVKEGASLLCGGKRSGSFYAPTILTGTNSKMRVHAEEIFGPVICIEPYSGNIADAIKKINDTRFGLQCGVFTDSVDELDQVFKHAAVGGVIHNNVPTTRFDHMPYGGVKDSGLGREGVKYAMLDMLEPRILVK